MDDTKRNNSDRQRKKDITKDEIIEKQIAEIEYLKAEIELLKKLELHERQVKRGKLVTEEAFRLIDSTVKSLRSNSIITHLCSVAGVSRSGYYSFLKNKDLREQRNNNDMLVRDRILQAFNLSWAIYV